MLKNIPETERRCENCANKKTSECVVWRHLNPDKALCSHERWSEHRDSLLARVGELLDANDREISKLTLQRDHARKFSEDAARKYNDLLQASKIVTCAFCGHEFPRGTPRHGDGALAEHVMLCPQHPMREIERENEDLRAEIIRLNGKR